jgi:hypothetical protein
MSMAGRVWVSGQPRISVAGRCRMANPGWLLRNAIQDQRTGSAGCSRGTGKSAVATVLTLVRAGYGVALVCAPGLLIAVTGGPGPRRAGAVARVLGVRHLVQAGLTVAALRAEPGSPVPLALGAGVDVLHASSMVGLALVDRGARRVALADTGVELALAAAGVLTATRH